MEIRTQSEKEAELIDRSKEDWEDIVAHDGMVYMSEKFPIGRFDLVSLEQILRTLAQGKDRFRIYHPDTDLDFAPCLSYRRPPTDKELIEHEQITERKKERALLRDIQAFKDLLISCPELFAWRKNGSS